ncbi:MAG: hypothetical protein ABL921_23340 [Pirellula sp.]
MLKLFQIAFSCVMFSVEHICILEAQESGSKATSPDSGSSKRGITAAKETKSASESQESEWTQRAKRILEIGIAGLTNEHKAELVKLKPSADDDPRYVFAFILVAIKEKQWASAQKYTAEILERHNDYLPARVAQARLLLTQDKKLDAVTELELLAKGLDTTSSDLVSSDQRSFAARFLGLAVGYLEGPGKESIKATTLQALIAETDKISSSHQGPFSQARLSVANEYETLVEKGEQALAELRQGLVDDAQEKRNELESQRAKTEAEAEAARKQLESNWATAAAAWNLAWSKCQSSKQIASSLQAQRGNLASSIALLRRPKADKDGNVDRTDERRYLDAKRRLDSEISKIDFQLNRTITEYEVAQRQGMVIENQMNALRVQAKRLGMTLATMSGSFAQADQILKTKEKSAKKVETKLSGNKLRQARAFPTYDDFSFHKEQTLLIDMLPKD